MAVGPVGRRRGSRYRHDNFQCVSHIRGQLIDSTLAIDPTIRRGMQIVPLRPTNSEIPARMASAASEVHATIIAWNEIAIRVPM